MRNRILLLLIGIVALSRSYAQVNLQTGSAVYSLPVFNWKDHKSRLNTAIALSYNSGMGLMTDGFSSNIGQGWSLAGGGVITRIQQGEPDDQPVYDGISNVSDVTRYPAGYLYNNDDPAAGWPKAVGKYPLFKSSNVTYKQLNSVAADKELDKFIFSFNGKSGVFVLNKDRASNANTGDIGLTLENSKLKITFQRDANLINQGIRTTITSFTIQDVDGLIYRFSNKGLTKILKTAYCDPSLNKQWSVPRFKEGNVYFESQYDEIQRPWVIDSWSLTEVEDPFTHRKILLNYNTKNINTLAGTQISHYNEKDYSVITYLRSITVNQQLAGITLPDGHTINFNYSAARLDMSGDDKMESIDVKYNGRWLSKHELVTNYFILNRYGNPTSAFQKRVARLCLLSVRKIGVDLKEDFTPYKFDYYLGSDGDDFVPPPFFHLKDIWGYYNGSNNVGFDWNEGISLMADIGSLNNNQLKGLCHVKKINGAAVPVYNIKSTYAKNGLMKQVMDPLGSSTTYEYQQNTGPLNGDDNAMVGGVHVSQITVTDGINNTCDNPLITTYDYVKESNSVSSMWGVETPVNYQNSASYYKAENKKLKYKFILKLICDYKFKYPGIMMKEGKFSLNWKEQLLMLASEALGLVGDIMTVIDIVQFLSTGTGPGAVIVAAAAFMLNLALTCLLNNDAKESSGVVYFNNNRRQSNPLPVQYARVVVTNGDGAVGRTVQEFTTPDDYALWASSDPIFSGKQRYASWAYGLPKRTLEYDKDGNLRKKTENTYEFIKTNFISDPENYTMALPSARNEVVKSISQRVDDWEYPNLADKTADLTSNPDLKVEVYDIFSGRAQLVTTKETTYATGQSGSIVTRNDYAYNDCNYLPNRIITYGSNSKKIIKEIGYSCDNYNEPYNAALALLVQNNVLGEVVFERSKVLDYIIGSSELELVRKDYRYSILSNGEVKISQIDVQRRGTPGGAVQTATVQSMAYDSDGLITEVTDEGGRKVFSLYGYDKKVVVASVINAGMADKPAYSSFENNTTGNWSLNAPAVFTGTSTVTGVAALSLSGQQISANINANKTYRLTYWADNTGIVPDASSGAVLKTSGPTINGFTYYEYEIMPEVITVTLSGTGLLDELRLYPVNARMRTVTYDVLVGKTSTCDENNRVTYYEYDNLGRQAFIRDEHRDIVKRFEYNDISVKGNCNSVYYNHAITEQYTKSNCGTGYQGRVFTYTVPAGKYSSSVSQADADLQAEQELAAHGQQNADNIDAGDGCALVYYNEKTRREFQKDNCPDGYKGNIIYYEVPAGTYHSIVSQAAADQLAEDDLDANGQLYANTNGTCVIDNDPDWQADDGNNPQTRCQKDANGNNTGHKEILLRDVNPNSSTYNSTAWIDIGLSTDCGATITCHNYKITIAANTGINDLYMSYRPCGSDGDVELILGSGALILTSNTDGSKYVTLCLRQPPTFRKGLSGTEGSTASGITVTNLGTCP
jgi:hypothetical protein